MAMTPARQIAVVTGAAYGIGRGIARLFSERGYAVAVAHDNQEAELRACSREAIFVRNDVRDEDSVRSIAIQKHCHPES